MRSITVDGAFVARPAPEDEQAVAVDAVAACLAGGRRAIVLVPEAVPLPATASMLHEAFGDRAVLFLGGGKRSRYRTWLEIAAGRYDVVIGTRPAVFAPVDRLGLLYVARESHPAHREDRAPVLPRPGRRARTCPSRRSRLRARGGMSRPPRRRPSACRPSPRPHAAGRRWRWSGRDRRAVRRGWSGRSRPRTEASCSRRSRGRGWPRSAARAGSRRPARRAAGCSAPPTGRSRASSAEPRGAAGPAGRAPSGSGAAARRTWRDGRAGRLRSRSVGSATASQARLPGSEEILVGGADDVRDLGTGDLDLVAILDVDLADRRPGLAARERSLATWMEAVGWARPRGRAIVQASSPGDPIVQALVRGNPDRFHAEERKRRRDAGLPVGAAVFRITGDEHLESELRGVRAVDPAGHRRGRADGMLARPRPRAGSRARDSAPRVGGERRRRPRRGRAAPVVTSEPTPELRRSRETERDPPHPNARRSGPSRARQAGDRVRPVAPDALRRHDRDDGRRARRGARRSPGRGLDAVCSCSTTARPGRCSWRIPSSPTGSGSCWRTRDVCRSPGRTTRRHGSRGSAVAGSISTGSPSEMVGEGLLARIFQHETDHLDGMLYIDRLDDEGRQRRDGAAAEDRDGDRGASAPSEE